MFQTRFQCVLAQALVLIGWQFINGGGSAICVCVCMLLDYLFSFRYLFPTGI